MHAALFALTLVTTLAAGALMAGLDPFAVRLLRVGEIAIPYPSGVEWSVLALGAPFALPFLGVLLAHEMGHYVAAKAHRVRATLPYFIPFPPYFSIIGTVGAFIRLLGPTVRRVTRFDVGSSGPLASFVVSLPLLIAGLGLSEAVPGRASLTTPFAIQFAGQTVWLGNGLLTHALATWLAPAPVGETLILLHPLALVGWLGLFVTTLNLLPLGQLDGGHVIYAIAPHRHGLGARTFAACLLPLGFLWWGWWAWAVIVLLVNRGRIGHPVVLQGEPSIGRVRRVLGWLLIAMFFVTFVPVPLRL
jgi:membrane-associated protease RseP (regulator of RpoE activity)